MNGVSFLKMIELLGLFPSKTYKNQRVIQKQITCMGENSNITHQKKMPHTIKDSNCSTIL